VNRIDQETEKEARAHKGCRAAQEEEGYSLVTGHIENSASYSPSIVTRHVN
jgi:hypothetical protein